MPRGVFVSSVPRFSGYKLNSLQLEAPSLPGESVSPTVPIKSVY